MNQRIQELAKQCYETGPIGKDGWPEYSRFNEQKFAKLIVDECADLANKKSLGIVEKSMLYSADQDEMITAKATAWQFTVFAQELKKHFNEDSDK